MYNSEEFIVEEKSIGKEVSTILYGYNSLNRIETNRALLDVKNVLGDNWINKLVDIVEEDDGYAAYNLIALEATPSDTLALSELLAKPFVAGDPDRSTKDDLLPKIVEFVPESPQEDRQEIIDNLYSAELEILELVSREMSSDDDHRSWYAENCRGDIYTAVLAQILCGDHEAIDKILSTRHPELTPHLVSQLESLRTKSSEELKTSFYAREPEIQYIPDTTHYSYGESEADHTPDYDVDEFGDMTDESREFRETVREGFGLFSGGETFSSGDIQEVVDQDRERVRQVIASIENFRQINGMIGSLALSRLEVAELIDGLNKISGSPEGKSKLEFIKSLLTSESSNQISLPNLLNSGGHTLNDLPELLGDESMIQLIAVMSKSLEKYKFGIALLLTQVDINLLPPEVLEKVKPVTKNLEFKLSSERSGWYVCSLGEPRLANAIDDGGVIAINSRLLVKFLGRNSALCTETFTTKDGHTFLEGCWYSPVDKEVRRTIQAAFDNGIGAIDLDNGGEWAFMRNGKDSEGYTLEDILRRSKAYIQKCINGDVPKYVRDMTRVEYRISQREGYT